MYEKANPPHLFSLCARLRNSAQFFRSNFGKSSSLIYFDTRKCISISAAPSSQRQHSGSSLSSLPRLSVHEIIVKVLVSGTKVVILLTERHSYLQRTQQDFRKLVCDSLSSVDRASRLILMWWDGQKAWTPQIKFRESKHKKSVNRKSLWSYSCFSRCVWTDSAAEGKTQTYLEKLKGHQNNNWSQPFLLDNEMWPKSSFLTHGCSSGNWHYPQ